MANIFDQYGIKEVVDGTFYALETDTRLGVTAGQPVLFLDTLKMSTVEVTAEQVEAKGGRGNTALIIWDFGKEITVTLQDALISPMSLALTSGASVTTATESKAVDIQRHLKLPAEATAKVTVPASEGTIKAGSTVYAIYGGKRYACTFTGNVITVTVGTDTIPVGALVDVFFTVAIGGTVGFDGDATVMTINAATFPGTYKFVGDTVIRSKKTGADEPFQLVIEKCKMSSEMTITMEAEGDPSVFDMNVRVLRDESGNMIKFIKYNLA